jgi:hypothetical protein
MEDVGRGRKLLDDSEWIERGWTLQELIAPRPVHFYDYERSFLGDKIELLDLLAVVTRVSAEVLNGVVSPQSCSIAEPTSWEAGRQTA